MSLQQYRTSGLSWVLVGFFGGVRCEHLGFFFFNYRTLISRVQLVWNFVVAYVFLAVPLFTSSLIIFHRCNS